MAGDCAKFLSLILWADVRQLVVSPVGAADLLEKMILAIAWHAANTRKNFKDDAAVKAAETGPTISFAF